MFCIWQFLYLRSFGYINSWDFAEVSLNEFWGWLTWRQFKQCLRWNFDILIVKFILRVKGTMNYENYSYLWSLPMPMSSSRLRVAVESNSLSHLFERKIALFVEREVVFVINLSRRALALGALKLFSKLKRTYCTQHIEYCTDTKIYLRHTGKHSSGKDEHKN